MKTEKDKTFVAGAFSAEEGFMGVAIIARTPSDYEQEEWTPLLMCGYELGARTPEAEFRLQIGEALLRAQVLCTCEDDALVLLTDNPDEMRAKCGCLFNIWPSLEIIRPQTPDHLWLLRRALREALVIRQGGGASEWDSDEEEQAKAEADYESAATD